MNVLAQTLAMNSLWALASFLGIDPTEVALGEAVYDPEFNAYVFKAAMIGTGANYRVRVTLAQNPGGGVPPKPICDVVVRQVS